MQVSLIFGPPGTGKTYRLLKILTELLKTYDPREIAYVSFTREGVNQGKHKAHTQVGISKSNLEYFRTLHSLAFKATNMNRQSVIQKKHYKKFSEKMGMNFTGYYTEEFMHNDDRYLFFNLLHRNNPKTAKNYLSDLDVHKLRHVGIQYKKFKEQNSIYDFTDMIEIFNKQNNAIPVKVAIIDEAQDLTTLQWEMIWVAFRNCEKVFIAGDDDQAIYEWSGADVEYFLNLDGKIETLNKSYRLPTNVLDFSKNILTCISKRITKEYESTGKLGMVHHIKSINEINLENGESWMILCRNRYFLKEVEQTIRNKGLPYIKYKEHSIKNEDVKVINFFEKVRKTKVLDEMQQVNLRLHFKENVDFNKPWYDNVNWTEDKITYFRDVIKKKSKDIDNPKIKIETIHSVKGDEADNVIVLDSISRQVYKNLQDNPDSEHRVFYVACTRAKNNLYIVHTHTPYVYKFH